MLYVFRFVSIFFLLKAAAVLTAPVPPPNRIDNLCSWDFTRLRLPATTSSLNIKPIWFSRINCLLCALIHHAICIQILAFEYYQQQRLTVHRHHCLIVMRVVLNIVYQVA